LIHNFQKTAEDNKYRSTERKKEQSGGRGKGNNTPMKSKLNSMTLNKKTRNFTPPEKSHSVSSITATQLLSLKNQPQRVTYESLKNLTEEFEHLRKFVKDLKISHEENCIMENEKKDFDRIKNDHIKLNADMGILKEDVKEILTNYQIIMKRVNSLEDENKNLRMHNKNLVKFIQGGNNQGNFQGQYGQNYNMNNFNSVTTPGLNIVDEEIQNIGNRNTMNTQNNLNNFNNQYSRGNINLENSTPLSELSAFHTMHNQSSMEMNYNINNNLEKGKKRRFLIPKTEEYQNNY
jgi:hypothetical protein